jgi:hypothetical protein
MVRPTMEITAPINIHRDELVKDKSTPPRLNGISGAI